MKLPITLACLAILLMAACQPVSDHRPAPVAAMTRTALSALPLPPLPHTLRVWVPKPTPTVNYVPTVTSTPPKASNP